MERSYTFHIILLLFYRIYTIFRLMKRKAAQMDSEGGDDEFKGEYIPFMYAANDKYVIPIISHCRK